MSATATYDFQGKTILITGGAGEIGKATAHRFAASGATIVLLDINEMRLAEVAQGLKDYGNPVYTMRCNVTDAQEVAEMFAHLVVRGDEAATRALVEAFKDVGDDRAGVDFLHF